MASTNVQGHQEALSFLRKTSSAHNLNLNLNRSEFIADCKDKNLRDESLRKIRDDIFTAIQVAGLADKRAEPISRRGSALHPLSVT